MNIYLYVLDTLADWEISYITAELNSGRYFKNKNKPISIVKISNSLEPIKTMGGIEITPDESIHNIDFNKNDILILPGADTWMDVKNKKVIDIVTELLKKDVIVCAICGATAALAEAGVLNNWQHTSNDKEYLEMVCPNYKGSNNYINAPVVIDTNLVTATGLAPIEFSYEVMRLTNLFKEETLTAWYGLYKTRESKYFFDLMNSLS
jgi:putative intracellular protease/amidase